MSVLADAQEYLDKMREHKECCGVPIIRRLVDEVETLRGMNANANGHIAEISNQLAAAMAARK